VAAEFLVERIFDQTICSPLRDGLHRKKPSEVALCGGNDAARETLCLAMKSANEGEIKMRKTILILLGSTLLTGLSIQGAAAAEHHKARKAVRATAPVSEPFRNSNAYLPASPVPDWERYANGWSAPAGR
jgi:hypothetical protein